MTEQDPAVIRMVGPLTPEERLLRVRRYMEKKQKSLQRRRISTRAAGKAVAKPFPCRQPGCSKSYSSNGALKMHLARDHPGRVREKASKCPLCGYEGPKQRRHIETKHKNDAGKEAALQALEKRTKTKTKH